MNVPTTSLVLIGLAISLVRIIPIFSLTHDAAFYLILPPILFLGGASLRKDHFKKDWRLILLLAVPGVIVTAFIIGYPLAYFWHIPLNYALLFGAIISPTDPVTVLAIMKKIKAPPRLKTILEAESLFNDGTGIVLYLMILNMLQIHETFNVSKAMFQFLLVAGGGALIGSSCGYAVSQILKKNNNPALQFILASTLIFGTPLLAGHFYCSGMIAVVTAGLMSDIKPNKFWKTIDFAFNAFIFLVIGLQLQTVGLKNLAAYKNALLISILLVIVSRALTVYMAALPFNLSFKSPMPYSWNHILFWGGLRGAIPIILMMQLPQFPYRTLFEAAIFAIVIFNLFVQGLIIEPLLNKLSLRNRFFPT